MHPLATDRLWIRDLVPDDASFILELLNEPAFIQYIGDKGLRDLAGAEAYLRDGPLASYARHGYGLRATTLKDGSPIGLCGLLKRDFLPHPDLGYALLTRYHGLGYASEAAAAVLHDAYHRLGLETIHAITAFRNPDSVKLLGKLGFDFVEFIQQPGYPEPSRLFIWHPSAPRP